MNTDEKRMNTDNPSRVFVARTAGFARARHRVEPFIRVYPFLSVFIRVPKVSGPHHSPARRRGDTLKAERREAISRWMKRAVIGGGSIEGKRRMLEILADVNPTDRPSVDDAAKKALQIVGNAQDLIVVSPRSLDEVKQIDASVAMTITPWVRRGSFRWIDVSDSSIDRWIVRDAVSVAKASRDDRQKVTIPELTEAT